MEIKASTEFRSPVRLVNLTGTAITGVTYNVISVYLQKQGQGSSQKSMTSNDWFEIDSANMPGIYDLRLTTTETNTVGFLKYYVSASQALPYVGILEIVQNLETDTYSLLNSITGSLTGTSSGSYSTDLGPITKILGKPNVTIADDLRQVGRISQDIQRKVS